MAFHPIEDVSRRPGGDALDRRRYEPNALRKRFRKALMSQTGAVESGRIPSAQPQPAIRLSTVGS